MFGKITSPISVLSTTEMVDGFGIDLQPWQHVVDIGWGLSILWAIVQSHGSSYTSVDHIYRYSQAWLTKVFVETVPSLIIKHLWKSERLLHLNAKIEELAHVFHGHPLISKTFFGITQENAQKRAEDMEIYIDRWFGKYRKETLLLDEKKYFAFLVAQYYGSGHHDIWSKQWIYELVRSIQKESSRAPRRLWCLWDTPKILYEAYVTEKKKKEMLIEQVWQLRYADLKFYTQLATVLSEQPAYTRSQAIFLPSTIQSTDPWCLTKANLVFCNFVLNGLDEEAKKTLLAFVAEHLSSKGQMYITVPEEDTATTEALMGADGVVKQGIVYWQWGKHDLEKLRI